MRISVGPDALRPLVERAIVLRANHTDLPGHLAASLTGVDAVQLGDTALARSLDRLGVTWATALECFADDARLIVENLRAVDEHYVQTEMAAAAAFAAPARSTALPYGMPPGSDTSARIAAGLEPGSGPGDGPGSGTGGDLP